MSMRYPSGGFITAIYKAELAPNDPTITTTSTGITQVTISFVPPTGPSVTSYLAVSSPGGLTGTSTSSPITVTGLTAGQAYTFTVYAVNSYNKSSGTVSPSVTPIAGYTTYAYGQGNFGALGIGNTTNYSSPKQVGTVNQWLQVAGGYRSANGIKSDGTLWGWGMNNYGQLGTGNITYRSSPVQVGALTNWAKLSKGNYHSLAIKTDGTLWAWGYNPVGELGNGNTTNYSSPIQIGALTTWAKVSVGGIFNSYAIRTDGTLWAWGRNAEGQLGLGNTTNYSSPKQVGALTSWSDVSGSYYSVLALRTNGTIWAWGQNGAGQLGVGNTNYYSSPKQIGSLTTWAYIGKANSVAGGNGMAFTAVKTDGTLWVWGNNSYGQCGQGTSGTNFSSPVQIGAETNWTSEVSCTHLNMAAVKTNGTLWGWGYGGYGTIGKSNGTNYSSPVQVGALTTWLSTTAGTYTRYSFTS